MSIGKHELHDLLKMTAPHCLTLMLPPPPLPPAPHPEKNLLKQAARELSSAGLDSRQVRAWLQRVRLLLKNHEQGARESLVILVSEDQDRIYALPYRIGEAAVVARRFYLKPFFLSQLHEEALVLALSAKASRLYHFSASGLTPRTLPPTPLPGDFESLRVAEVRSEGLIWKKKLLLDYCRRVDAGLAPQAKELRLPLILAAAEPLYSIYREISAYPRLLAEGLPGNPDKLSLHELLQLVLGLRRSVEQDARRQDLLYYQNQHAAGRTIHHPRSILEAAEQGHISLLFLSDMEHLWGRPLPEYGWEFHPHRRSGDEDLLERAAAKTYLSGGKVYLVDRKSIPDQAIMAAALRSGQSASVTAATHS